MKILYAARHGSGGNEDENAITYALRLLGHEVIELQERELHHHAEYAADFLLCHHPANVQLLSRVRIPKVFWCFDLIDWPEPAARHAERRAWAAAMRDVCDLGFHTDGDWVAKDTTGKLRWLTQGADERDTLMWNSPYPVASDVLFVGGLGYGRGEFVAELEKRYGQGFRHVQKGCYGPRLKQVVSQAKVVVAPPQPVTDRYWSNRAYNMLKHGASLLHPCSDGLLRQLGPECLAYYNVSDIHERIAWLLSEQGSEVRKGVAANGQQTVLALHTYRHRCADLIREVEKIL